MQVKDVMLPSVGHLEPDGSLRDAAEQLKALNLDPMPVVEGGRVVGVLSEGELAEYAARQGLAAGSAHVRDVMSRDVTCCRADDDLHATLARLGNETNRRFPVVDADSKLVGVVSVTDLRARAQTVAGEVDAVSDVNAIESLVQYDEDPVDFMSDASFPASDPIPPPTTTGDDRP